MSDVAKKVETLMEAMPYLEKYQGKVIVIKYGGNAMINDELKDAVLHDVVMLKLLGLKPVLSHGGGPGINKMLEKLNIPVQFINGLRYTSEDIMRVVEMVLVGQVNTELVGRINQIGGKAVGLSGVSGAELIGSEHRGAGRLGLGVEDGHIGLLGLAALHADVHSARGKALRGGDAAAFDHFVFHSVVLLFLFLLYIKSVPYGYIGGIMRPVVSGRPMIRFMF